MKTSIPRRPVKKIDGGDWNTLVKRRPGRLQLGARKSGGRDAHGTETIDITNHTGADLNRFSIVRLGDPVVTVADDLNSFKADVRLKAEIPDGGGNAFAILQEPARVDCIAEAIVAGVTQVRLNGTGPYADTTDGVTGYLECGASGPARVLWSEPGTGERWGMVLLAVRSSEAVDKLRVGSFTALEYDPVAGAMLHRFDRNRPRAVADVIDLNCLISSDGFLYSGGSGFLNQHTGVLAKWDADTGELLWHSAAGVLHSPPLAGGSILDQCVFEASDGFIWTCGTYLARHDPADGAQTHEYLLTASQLLRADGSGGVVVAGVSGLRVFDASMTQTASIGAMTGIEEHAGRLYCFAGNTLYILNAATLATIDSRTAPVGETYAGVVTDGTTVWTITNDHYRAYDASNLATENWNAARTANGTVVRLIHAGSSIYEFGAAVRKVSDSAGTVAWTTSATATPTNGMPSLGQAGTSRRRMGCAVGSDFVLCCATDTTTANLWCYNDSDGSARWCDHFRNLSNTALGAHGVAVTDDDRVFVCGVRTVA